MSYKQIKDFSVEFDWPDPIMIESSKRQNNSDTCKIIPLSFKKEFSSFGYFRECIVS